MSECCLFQAEEVKEVVTQQVTQKCGKTLCIYLYIWTLCLLPLCIYPKVDKRVILGPHIVPARACGVGVCVRVWCRAPVAPAWHPCGLCHLLCSLRGTHTPWCQRHQSHSHTHETAIKWDSSARIHRTLPRRPKDSHSNPLQ